MSKFKMEIKDAFKRRTNAKRQFTITLQGIEDIIDTKGPIITVNKWMQEAKMKWAIIQEKHEDYVMLKDDEEGADKDMEWLVIEGKRLQEIEIKVDRYIDDIERARKEEADAKQTLWPELLPQSIC